MSTEKIQFKPDELISFFIVSDPPENHSEFLPVFSAECQMPLDQSLFTNNWRQKQTYYRPNNRNITLGGSSSSTFGTTPGDSQQPPIQNTSSTPLTTFSPLPQDSVNQQNSPHGDQQYSNPQIKNFQPPTFQPTNLQSTNFQPTSFQPTNPIPANFQPATFQPSNLHAANFQPVNSSVTNFQPALQASNFQPTQLPASNFQPASLPTANFQPATLPVSSFQPTSLSASNFQANALPTSNFQPMNPQLAPFQPAAFQPAYPQATNFQPANMQQMNFQAAFNPAYSTPTNFQPMTPPSTFQPAAFQPTYPQAPSLQPTNFQPTDQFQQVIQQPDISYNNQPYQNDHYIPQQIPEPQFTQQDNISYQDVQTNEVPDIKDENENNEKYSQEAEEEKEQPDQGFVYFKPQFETFESVIGEQNEEKAEEEAAKQKQFQEQMQNQQEEQKQIQESWVKKNSKEIPNHHQPDMNEIIADQQYTASIEEEQQQKRQEQQQQQQKQESWVKNSKEKQNHQPSINDIIADQKVISSIEAQQQQEQFKIQQQQKNKSSVGSWADTNVRQSSSKPAFEDIFEKEKSKVNTQPKQMPKVPKGSTKGKITKMSFQDLQREMSKPSQWDDQLMKPPVTPISNIIESASESSKSASNSNVPTTGGKGKKSKKKKEVYDYQEFYRMNEEQDRAKKEAIWAKAAAGGPTGKSFSTISTEALIESEKNRQNLPPPTPAPIQKRANHRGRGKDLSAKSSAPQQPKWNYDEEEDYYYEPKQAPKQSFDSITNSELAKQNKNQSQTKTNQTATTTTNTASTNSGTTSKKKKQKYQLYQETNQTQTSSWGAVSGSNKATTSAAPAAAKKPIDFSQLQQNEIVDQAGRSTNTKPAASNVSAVQPKKKKKAKKIVYVDNYIKNHQENATPYNYDDSSFSDDDDYYGQYNPRPAKPANTKSFNELLNSEKKTEKKKQAEQPNVHISSFAAKQPSTNNQKPSFEALTQQEIDRQQASKPQPPPVPNNMRNNKRGFENLIQDEKEMKESTFGGDVQIMDDSEIRIPSKKPVQQPQKAQLNQPKPKKNAKKNNQDLNEDLFWGRATKADDYADDANQIYEEDDVDDEEQFFGGSKPKHGNERASYLQHLIEIKLGSQDDDLYDFAIEIINKDRNGMIRSLRSLLEESDAKNVVASFFARYPK